MHENNGGQGVKMELPKPGKALKLTCKASDKWFIVNTENDLAVVVFDTPGGTQSEYSLGYGNVIEALAVLDKYVKFEYEKYDWRKQEDVKTFGYGDRRYLTPEPLYEQKQASYKVVVADAEVFLLPDSTSKKVLNFRQGETVQGEGSVVIKEQR